MYDDIKEERREQLKSILGCLGFALMMAVIVFVGMVCC